MGLIVSEAAQRIERTGKLRAPVSSLRFVSGKRELALKRLGMKSVRDVLWHLPSRYLDFTHQKKIAFCEVGSDVTIIGTVDQVMLKRPKPKMQIVEVWVTDETGVLVASFFGKPWLQEQFKVGEVVALSGKVTFSYGFKRMQGPFFEVLGADDTASHARIVPVHAVGEGVTASWMRRIISCAVEDASDIVDPVPASIVARLRLMGEGRALRAVHFPTSLAEAECARRRLAFDELVCLQLTLLCRQKIEQAGVVATAHVTDGPKMDALLRALPFELTDEQRQAADEILSDMAQNRVMNRLLLGDVGTGKTAVALLALAAVADTGTQAAMMAPTSVLARQYADKLSGWLDAASIRWALVTGSTPAAERARIADEVASGELSVLFGTTALLSDDFDFRRLSLVVVDEQHRFGVNQRLALRGKGPGADMLTMSATPIPRTLALSVYGDLALSQIRHKPRAGAKITTRVLAPENTDIAYGSVRDAVAAGERAYVICPLVDEKDTGDDLDDVPAHAQSNAKTLHAATTTAEHLAHGPFRGCSVGVLTGRTKAEEKADVMARFARGEIDVLVATTVVEVGVDVPEATRMIVLDADRFGLATLHQLRGRVGRGAADGEVFLVCAAKKGSAARERLGALEATSDGFELAELDLKLRREGEVLGYRQHGGVTLKVTDLAQDADLVEAAHVEAQRIAECDPELTRPAHRLLADECLMRFGAYFQEVERV